MTKGRLEALLRIDAAGESGRIAEFIRMCAGSSNATEP